jgi:hypothetical protein
VLRLQREPHGQVLQSRGQALLQERLLQVIIQIYGSPGSAETSSGIPTDIWIPFVLQELLQVIIRLFWVPWFYSNDFLR